MSISPVLGERHSLQIPEGPIEYRVTGAGPTIVFLHGIIANGDVWRAVVADLAQDHRCITLDWPLGAQGAHAFTMQPGTDFSLPGLPGWSTGSSQQPVSTTWCSSPMTPEVPSLSMWSPTTPSGSQCSY